MQKLSPSPRCVLSPRAVALTLITLMAVVLTAPTASAQTPAGEIAGGYEFMRDWDVGTNFPTGFWVSGGGYVHNNLSIVGEFSRNSTTKEAGFVAADLSVTTYMAGVRVSRREGPATSFAQFLVGGATGGATVSVFGFSESDSTTAFAIQSGGGIDIHVAENTAVRFAADYRYVDGPSQFRIVTGLVVGFGER